MKLIGLILFIGSLCHFAAAQQKSEEALVNKILIALAQPDDSMYAALFPVFDTLVLRANTYRDTDVVSANRIRRIRSNPRIMQQFDPFYNTDIVKDFRNVYQKGRDSGIHWSDLLLARYELEKAMLAKELIGFERVVPIRLQGYVFVQDLLTRRIYCIALKDVHSFNNKWYGGHVVNIIEAETIDEYLEKLAKERKLEKLQLLALMYGEDTVGAASDSAALAAGQAPAVKKADEDEEEKIKITTQVAERKLYTGRFDKELKVELYVRGLKGSCPQTICAWEAAYKFQDMDGYIKLEVTRSPEGKFILTEEDIGVMEVSIKGGKVTGEWTSFKDKTEYEVDLSEKPEVSNKKLLKLDALFESE